MHVDTYAADVRSLISTKVARSDINPSSPSGRNKRDIFRDQFCERSTTSAKNIVGPRRVNQFVDIIVSNFLGKRYGQESHKYIRIAAVYPIGVFIRLCESCNRGNFADSLSPGDFPIIQYT